MTVSELIDQLTAMPADAPIRFWREERDHSLEPLPGEVSVRHQPSRRKGLEYVSIILSERMSIRS
jgi:hypothetical protein